MRHGGSQPRARRSSGAAAVGGAPERDRGGTRDHRGHRDEGEEDAGSEGGDRGGTAGAVGAVGFAAGGLGDRQRGGDRVGGGGGGVRHHAAIVAGADAVGRP